MIFNLLLLASSYWVDVDNKQALVCDINHIQLCLNNLDTPTLALLPTKIARYKEMMGLHHAMVLPITTPEVTGLILINPKETPKEAFAIVRNVSLRLTLKQQQQLSLWHEQGHLVTPFLSHGLSSLTKYQHEWLADLYLLWQSVSKTKSKALAWQQLHRRSLDVINDPANLNHWSSPILLQVLNNYTVGQILGFQSYADFFAEVYPKIKQLNGDEQAETYNLIRFLFDDNSTRDLPNYLYWRRPKLASVLEPTFLHILGKRKADNLLKNLNLANSFPE